MFFSETHLFLSDYDKDSRLSEVFSSRDGIIWDKDARYLYYEHGPLARTEIGEQKVQALDYAYTLQGWLKGVNSDNLEASADIGKDAHQSDYYITGQTALHGLVGKDAFGFSIGYFNRDKNGTLVTDYTPARSVNTAFLADISANSNLSNASGAGTFDAPSMYNGNIKHLVTTLTDKDPSNSITDGSALSLLTGYRYDQLYRLRQMKAYKNLNVSTNSFGTSAGYDGSYETTLTYDKNGNILTHNRKGNGGLDMDQLSYKYDWNNNNSADGLKSNNRLYHVSDNPAFCSNSAVDIDDQGTFTSGATIGSVNNYSYDEIGNLKKDNKEYITEIKYNIQGKISEVIKSKAFKYNDANCNGTQDAGELEIIKEDLEFKYDAFGRRVAKIVKPHKAGGVGLTTEHAWTTTYYVLDASGNQLTTYTKAYTSPGRNEYLGTIKQQDHTIYGSSRLGVDNRENTIATATIESSEFNTDGTFVITNSTINAVPHLNPNYLARTLGQKQYELSNHLGNVQTVVTDRKIPVNSVGAPTIISFYTADIASYTDYYPFGMEMPGRTYTSESYNFGFNNKKNDDEIQGVKGSIQDYGMRQYDTRLGRFMTIDPLTANYPWYSPYQFAGNKPIWATDLDGEEEYLYQYIVLDLAKGMVKLKKATKNVDYSRSRECMMNLNTGNKFQEHEWGKIQYEYYDIKGNKLNIRRTSEGRFVNGANELMDDHLKNFFGSIYIGNENPETESGLPDYRREPIDLADAAALAHDQDYDKEEVKGISGVLSQKTLAADLSLLSKANEIIRDYSKAKIDPYTNRPISEYTYKRAMKIKLAFTPIAGRKISSLSVKGAKVLPKKPVSPKKPSSPKKDQEKKPKPKPSSPKKPATNPPLYPKTR